MGLAAAGALAATFTAGAAGSQPREYRPRLRLSWVRGQGAGTCPPQGQIEAEVGARLGYHPFDVGSERSIEALVVRRDGAFELAVHLRDVDGGALGTRELSDAAESCAGISEAAVLAIALLIDPDAPLRPQSPPPAQPPPAQPRPALPPPPPPATPPLPSSVAIPPATATDTVHRHRWLRGGGEVSALFLAGALPRPALGFATEAYGYPLPILRLGLGARVLPPVANASEELSLSLVGGFVRLCGQPFVDARWSLLGCLAGHFGGLGVTIRELVPLQVGQRWWGSAEGSLEARLAVVGPLTLGLGARFEVPVVRDDLRVRGRGDRLHRSSAVAGGGAVTVGVDFF